MGEGTSVRQSNGPYHSLSIGYIRMNGDYSFLLFFLFILYCTDERVTALASHTLWLSDDDVNTNMPAKRECLWINSRKK